MTLHEHLSHDLPKPRIKGHVFRDDNGCWVWEHQCTHGSQFVSLPAEGQPWEKVFNGLTRHLEWCL